MQAACQFIGHRCENLRRAHPTRDQRCNPPQRGLLLGEHTELISACLGFAAALFCLGGAQSGLARENVGQQRDGQENQR